MGHVSFQNGTCPVVNFKEIFQEDICPISEEPLTQTNRNPEPESEGFWECLESAHSLVYNSTILSSKLNPVPQILSFSAAAVPCASKIPSGVYDTAKDIMQLFSAHVFMLSLCHLTRTPPRDAHFHHQSIHFISKDNKQLGTYRTLQEALDSDGLLSLELSTFQVSASDPDAMWLDEVAYPVSRPLYESFAMRNGIQDNRLTLQKF